MHKKVDSCTVVIEKTNGFLSTGEWIAKLQTTYVIKYYIAVKMS